MDSSPLSLLETPIPTSNINSNPMPASNPNPNPCNYSKSAQGTSKSVQYMGVWLKKGKKKKEEKDRYATEIAYRTKEGSRRRIWLGTYDTPVDAAIAYDLAVVRMKRSPPNNFIGKNGEIQAPIPLAKQKSIRRAVENLMKEKYNSGDSSNQVGKNRVGRKKKVPEGSETASLSGSGAGEQ